MTKKINENMHNVCFIGIKKTLEGKKTAFRIIGTGLILNNKELITCAHIYNNIPRDYQNSIFAGIREEAGKKINKYNDFPLKLKAKDNTRDLALFEISDNEEKLKQHGVDKSILMTKEDINKLELATQVHFIGFPLGNEFLKMGMGITSMVSQCIIGAIKFSNKDQKIDFLLVDKQINPGNSGSPVFLNGKIIGLASGTINQTHKIGESLINVPIGVGIIRTSNYILALLDDKN